MIPLIAANWKMNLLKADALSFCSKLSARVAQRKNRNCDIVICPPFSLLSVVRGALNEEISVGAQTCDHRSFGPHTGDINCLMLKDLDCNRVIVGHSERRTEYYESDKLVQLKAESAIAADMSAIICVGESAEERAAGKTLETVYRQVRDSMPGNGTFENVAIAYEPLWAIGTGLTPSLDQIAEVHEGIRDLVSRLLHDGEKIRILYGGSVNPSNAEEILSLPAVNGGLVGGASLNLDDFWSICCAASDTL